MATILKCDECGGVTTENESYAISVETSHAVADGVPGKKSFRRCWKCMDKSDSKCCCHDPDVYPERNSSRLIVCQYVDKNGQVIPGWRKAMFPVCVDCLKIAGFKERGIAPINI